MNKNELNKIENERSKQNERTLPRGLYITTKIGKEHDAKSLIADTVVSKYIHDFDAVLLDAGSTAELIAEKMFAEKKFLSVLTNNMGAYAAYTRAGKSIISNDNVKDIPNNGNELLISGGRYVDVYEALLGERAMTSIENFTPNVIIIGTSGLTCDGGIFCHGSEESAVKRLLLTKFTDTRLIATDWTKIGKIDALSFGTMAEFRRYAKNAVVVTNLPPKELYKKDSKRMQEFDDQLKIMENEFDIVVERISIINNKIENV